MTDICIPITHLGDNEVAEVTVKIGGVDKKYSFKVEAFPWDPFASIGERILMLKDKIESYGNEWEIVQIYSPGSSSNAIHVLFKKKNEAS